MAGVISASGKREPVWPAFKTTKPDPVLGKKEMSPEQTLVEFISTSASLHGVRKQPLRSLEWDLLKVFPYNIMPANAAAWYMAKRKYYADQPPDLQLLPFLLKKYPAKFFVTKSQVEFLENYSKETARKKLNYLVQFGLDAYFSHKVDEYGVYFFDPNYYERTEPFHESLRLLTKGDRTRLVHSYFSEGKKHYHFQTHSSNLASLSKQPGRKVLTNTTGVIISMINNQYGFIKFGSGEKALFCAKALFRDGFQYSGDPLRLPAMFFDGYKVVDAQTEKAVGYKDDSDLPKWIATLVWCGRKPAPKYYSTTSDFNETPVGLKPVSAPPLEGRKLRQPSSSMMIGQVVGIRKNGAVVSVRDDSQEKIFIPGWSKENDSRSGVWLTTLAGDTIGLRDLVAYYIDTNETMPGFTAVGKNVMVLKEHEEVEARRKPPRRSISMSTGGDYEPRGSTYSTASAESEDSDDATEDSEAEQVSDSELEWLENDLDEMIKKDGPEAKTHSLFLRLKESLTDVRTRGQKKKATREGPAGDSGMESTGTTPNKGKNVPMKTPTKNEKEEEVFWRTKVAFAKIDENYRSSDDEDYESGDEIQIFGGGRRRRRQSSTVSAAALTSGAAPTRTRRQRSSAASVSEKPDERNGDGTAPVSEKAEGGGRGEDRTMPYWVRAVSMLEEYDEQSGMFVPVDRNYKEENDPDYVLPLTDDEYEEEIKSPKPEEKEPAEDKPDEVKSDDIKPEEGEAAVATPASEKEGEEEKKPEEDDLSEELKLLIEESTQELPEDLLEGKHRGSAQTQKSPEKIVVTKPEGEETLEVVDIEEPHKIFYAANYLKFAQQLNEDYLPSDSESLADPEFVPAPVIYDEDLDYDEYDPDEEIDPAEVSGLAEDLKKDLQKEANMIPIWVHVDSVKERKARAVEDRAERERERLEKEALLAAAQKTAAETPETPAAPEKDGEDAAPDNAGSSDKEELSEKVTRAKVEAVATA